MVQRLAQAETDPEIGLSDVDSRTGRGPETGLSRGGPETDRSEGPEQQRTMQYKTRNT
jgi:hypothetical protein